MNKHTAEDENTYEEWRILLLDQGILSKDGLIDLVALEEKYPGELDEEQVIWIERMQKGGVSNPASDHATRNAFNIDDTFKIQVEADEDPEEVTIVRIARDGIHLASSKDENTEYLVDPEELKEMIIE